MRMAAKPDKSAEEFRRMNNLLSRLPDRNPGESKDEGENYICPTCELPVKPCEIHVGACCHLMLKESTELSLLEQRIHEVSHGIDRSCIQCGQMISSRQMKADPMRELCSDCKKKAVRKKRR